METGPAREARASADTSGDFTERLVDGFFRRSLLYLVPVVLFAALGVYTARGITADYSSYATLSATSNPYLATPTIRGTEIAFYESPGDGTARLINEQLRTDAFIDDVAESAGLKDAIESGQLTRATVRGQLGASGAGQNTLRVSARWADPDTAYQLTKSTIEIYTAYLATVASADSVEAVDFWTERLNEAAAEVQRAEDALDGFLALLPPVPDGQNQPIAQDLELQRLSTALDNATQDQRDAQDAVDEAQLTANQAARNSARGLTVIDPPEIAFSPEPVRRDKAVAIAVFTLLGVLIGFAALVLTTLADHSVRTRSQLIQASGVESVAVIPRIKRPRRSRRPPSVAADEAA
jgi:uncharacterized protein involved in exopolysaccharide biosynthesis